MSWGFSLFRQLNPSPCVPFVVVSVGVTEGEGKKDGDVGNSRTTEIHTGSLQLLTALKVLMERICVHTMQGKKYRNDQYITYVSIQIYHHNYSKALVTVIPKVPGIYGNKQNCIRGHSPRRRFV